jgi:putative oxidoreductase
MDRLYSRFPGGGVGFGLLLLRLIVAAWFFETAVPMFGAGPVASIFAIVLMSTALLLIAGAGTSANASVGAVCCIVSLLLGSKPDQWFPVMSLTALSSSLALLGPGGYSLDARLSGWRTINLSSRPPADRLRS